MQHSPAIVTPIYSEELDTVNKFTGPKHLITVRFLSLADGQWS